MSNDAHAKIREQLIVRRYTCVSRWREIGDPRRSMEAGRRALPRMRSAAFSAIMMVGAFVFDEVICGITDASQILTPLRPRSLSSGSTTAISCVPMAQVPQG